MNSLHHFKDINVEQEYRALKRKVMRTDYLFYSIASLLVGFVSLIVFIIIKEISLLVCALVLLILSIVYFALWKFTPKKSNLFNIIASVLIYATFLYCLVILKELNTYSPVAIFFQGYIFANLQQTLQNKMFTFRSITSSHILMFLCRSFIVGSAHLSELVSYPYFVQLAFDIILVCLKHRSEKRERSLFKEFHDYREELSKFKELLTNHLPQNIMIVNHDKTPLFINQNFKKTFNLEEERVAPLRRQTTKLLGSLKIEKSNSIFNSIDKFIKESGPIVMKEMANYRAGEESKDNLFSYENCGDKGTSLFQVTLFNIKWDGEEALVIILDDITDREELIALRVADTNKDQVIATVSHELRTPLNGILGLAAIAEKKTNDPEVAHYMQLCQNNATLLLNVVNSILDLQQIRKGVLKLNLAWVEMTNIMNQLQSLFEYQCLERNLYITCEVGENVPKSIFTDENRLKQILINIIGNALKFTFEGGITVKVEGEHNNDEYVTISVSDTGIGISDEDKRKLFKMYGKLEKTANVNKNGVGLGLTISENLARLLGGIQDDQAISLESEVGKGAKFTFNILTSMDKNVPSEAVQTTEQNNKGNSNENSSMTDLSLYMEERLAKYDIKSKEGPFSTIKESPLFKDVSPHNFFALHNTTEENISAQVFSPNVSSNIYSEDAPLNKSSPKKASIFTFNTPSTPLKLPPKAFSAQFLKFSNHKLESHTKLTGPWILVVDDNTFNLLVAQNMLEGRGYRVKTAFSGKEAIEIVKKHILEGESFKLILMDCQMPIMDGFETTRELKAMMKRSEIPEILIIALTANSAKADIEKCYESGMDGHLCKPLKEENLNKIVPRLLTEGKISF